MNVQDYFLLLRHPELANSYLSELEDMLVRYPWFMSGKLLLSAGYHTLPETDVKKKILQREMALHSFACNYHPIQITPSHGQPDTMAVINRFLTQPPKRITPPPFRQGEESEVEDLAAANGQQAEVASEPLALIYEKQGLYSQAIEIYEKLSLKFPEKSIYFANRITELRTK